MPESIIRKSGNSTVLVIPANIVKQQKIREGEQVEFEIFRKRDLKSLFGKGSHLKIDSQAVKDELRKEW